MCGSWRCHGDGSVRGHSPATSPPGSGAAMAATHAAGLQGRGRSAGARKANLSQHVQELHTIITLQGAAPSASRGQPGEGGGSWSLHRPAWYQQQLNVLQSKGGSFSRSHGRKSLVRTESCSPTYVRRRRRTSVPWALFRRYRQVPCAVPLPGAGPAEPAPPAVLSRSRQRRAALGCDRPQAGSDMLSLPLSCSQCNKLTISEACRAQKHLGITLARKTVEVTAGSGKTRSVRVWSLGSLSTAGPIHAGPPLGP